MNIELCGLTKRYGETLAVDALTVTVRPGVVTGFLGPNGAGKTTTLRMILGVDRPTSGIVTIGGMAYADLPSPMRAVGAVLDPGAVHGGRTVYGHLRCAALSNGLPRHRIDAVLGLAGLADVAGRRCRTLSLGMSQRLGIAAALLGDPAVLLLDEPVNGLDPEGIHWIRTLMRDFAREGRTVLVSSHLMSEMAITADHLIVIGRGRLIADTGTDALVRQSPSRTVRVRTPDATMLAVLIAQTGAEVRSEPDGTMVVTGLSNADIGRIAASNGVVLYELIPEKASLEEAFMSLTRDSVEYGVAAGERW